MHLLAWPGKAFHLDGVKSQTKSAYLLADPKRTPLKLVQDGNKLDVQLPDKPLDPLDTVLVIETK